MRTLKTGEARAVNPIDRRGKSLRAIKEGPRDRAMVRRIVEDNRNEDTEIASFSSSI